MCQIGLLKQQQMMPEYCLQDNAVVTALIGLFKAFAERETSKAASQAVDPTQLRVALGNLEGDKFRVGAEPAPSLFAQWWHSRLVQSA